MSTTPRLRVLAGPSYSELTDISGLVNINRPHTLLGAHFEGSLIVHIKGFPDAPDSEYFEREERRGVTWSIQVQGRFLSPHSADDILFGNTFDRPLKLPWGSAAALKFMTFIDPALEHDLSGPRPWALSPLISTMPHFAHSRCPEIPTFPPCTPRSISDDTTELVRCRRADAKRRASRDDESGSGGSRSSSGSSLSLSDSGSGRSKESRAHSDRLLLLDTANKRRAYFRDAAHRKRLIFSPNDVLTTDFCYGFLSFPSLALNLPGGVSFDLKKYWDGQPVRFVCVERTRSGDAPGEGTMFWCVVFEAAED